MRDIFLSIDIFTALGLLSIALLSLVKRGYKNSINRIFAGFSVFVALWILSNNFSNNVTLPVQLSLVSNYAVYASSFGVSILLSKFVVKLADIKKLNSVMGLISVPAWGICLVSLTPLIVSGIRRQGEVYAVEFGPLMWLYAVGLMFMVSFMMISIFIGVKSNKGLRRQQLVNVGIGIGLTVPLVVFLSFIFPTLTGIFYVTEFGIAPGAILVFSLYHGIVKYRLFDIRLAMVRAGAYALTLLTLSLIYYYLAFIISVLYINDSSYSSFSADPINVFLALILAFVFQPIKKLFDKFTNKLFYKDNYNSDEFFSMINQIVAQTTNMVELLRNSSNEIKQTIKLEQVFFSVIKKDGSIVTVGTNRHNKIPSEDVNFLNDYTKNGLNKLFLPDILSDNNARRLMISHRIELILPLVISDELVGYMCLGDKKSSSFTSRDISVLKTASDELTIAIKNSLAIQEIRDLNDSLQQKISNATKELRASNAQLQRLDKAKDEFVSMASHQLRTPLTTVKGYISMVVEGDAGEITSEQRRLLDEAFMSSERMVNLINDFLNVSRIQTGKFLIDKHETNLGELVKQEIDRLKSNADSRKLEFIYKKPKDFPIMNIDEAKIREVVMNFADNALYYSHEGAKIDVKLHVDENNQAIFEIIDTGIGVSLEDQSRLFTKFYRASNAKRQRPDGTGVGLFLAKKVISAHGGKVLFSSVEGKGSTFGFSLPVE